MKRYNIFIIATLLFGAVLNTGCSDDFLQKSSLSASSSGNFWQTADDAYEGLTAVYDAMQNPFLYNDATNQSKWDGCGPLNMDCMTDNGGRFNWSGWMNGWDIANGIHSSSSRLVEQWWIANYEAIKRCNSFIANVGRTSLDDASKEQYSAEVKVIRALMYLNLTMTYHDVPFITAPQSMSEAYTPKTDRATIVKAIVEDLKAAAEILPVNAPETNRITRGAALSILGRTALYNDMWDEAIDAYHKVIALGKYRLFDDYTQLFTETNENCPEIIMSVSYQGPGKNEGCGLGGHWGAPLEAMNGTIDLADAFYMTDGKPCPDKRVIDFYADGSPNYWDNVNTLRYENRDPRLKATLFVPGMSWNGNSSLYGGSANSYSTIYVMKYFNPALSSSDSWDSGQDFYIVRYAEVLLSLAEAEIEKGTNFDEAVRLIDQVRERAKMPSVESVEGTGLSQEQLREIVRHERRVETAFEGLRLFDIYRWHILKDAVDRVNNEAKTYKFPYEYRNYRGEKEYVWPIPQPDIDSNPSLEQNDLWK